LAPWRSKQFVNGWSIKIAVAVTSTKRSAGFADLQHLEAARKVEGIVALWQQRGSLGG
jgi:hypothetical protein